MITPKWDDPDAGELLPLPRTDGLTQPQLDGETCVWCSVKPRVPFRLGIRLSSHRGRLLRWTPIAHKRCASTRAARVHRIHIQSCARCSHGDYCPDSRALHALALGYR